MHPIHIQEVGLQVLTIEVGVIKYKKYGARSNDGAIVHENNGNFLFEMDTITATKLKTGDTIGLIVVNIREPDQLPIILFLVINPSCENKILVGAHTYFHKFFTRHFKKTSTSLNY